MEDQAPVRALRHQNHGSRRRVEITCYTMAAIMAAVGAYAWRPGFFIAVVSFIVAAWCDHHNTWRCEACGSAVDAKDVMCPGCDATLISEEALAEPHEFGGR